MGNDGGSIPKRRELVKSAARTPTTSELKATVLESLAHAWAHDALTSEPLDPESVVSDWRGRLYNYETILEKLLPGDGEDDGNDGSETESAGLTFAATGIKSLRDVVRLRFTRNATPGGSAWTCPVSQKELGPATKAVYLVPCGHVFADVAIRTIREDACPECAEPFARDNVVDVLPALPADIDRLARRRDALSASGLTHSLKKDKSGGKSSKKKRKAEDAEQKLDQKKRKDAEPSAKPVDSRISGINNPMAASLTAKVLAEQDVQQKRRKLAAR